MANYVKSEVLKKASAHLESWLEYRKPRFDQIKKAEDMYMGKTKPALKGRFNIPVPILEGYVDTLLSKIDDQISVRFVKSRQATLKIAKKLTSAWEEDASPDRGAYNEADLDSKQLAIFAGFGVFQLTPTSKPHYMQTLEAVDHWDVIAEPFGGRDLEKHLFKGRMNIFKTKPELLDGVEQGIYNRDEVQKLINNQSEAENKQIQDDMQGKINRYLAMGLNPTQYNYVGTGVFNLTAMVLKIDGEDYYVLFSYDKQCLIRCQPLKEIFPTGLSPWVSWHTQRNPVSFLNRAPVDSVYPVAEAMRILINQNFDNIQKRNWDMVLYNARKILNPSQLQYRPNGLIEVKLNPGESIDTAYTKMETPDTSSVTINLMQWLDSFLGQKTGVTPGSQGASDEDKVGIYYGNLQQVADRFGLLNKYYKKAHVEIAKRWKDNLHEHMPAKGFMVKMIGLQGIYDEELSKEEVSENLGINIVSSNIEAQADQVTQQKKESAIDRILKVQELRASVSPSWLLEEILRLGEYDEERIKEAISGQDGSNAELMSEAAQAIEMIENGEKPEINQGATTAYIRKIATHAMENAKDDTEFKKFMMFAVQHIQIAKRNASVLLQLQPEQVLGDVVKQQQPQPQPTAQIPQ